MVTNLFPSRLIKCGYCKLKCKSRSVSKNDDALPPMLPNDVLFKLHAANDGGALPVVLPNPTLLLPVRNVCGTGISWDLNVRLELCIFTANDNDVRSGGNGIISVSLVIDTEHNLQKRREKKKKDIELTVIWIWIRLEYDSAICQVFMN